MNFLRSEPMKLGTLVIPREGAKDFVNALGISGFAQIRDMNEHSMVRLYKRYIQRIEEMERILRFLFEHVEKLTDIPIQDLCKEVPTEYITDNFQGNELYNFNHIHYIANYVASTTFESGAKYNIDKVEESLDKVYTQFLRFSQNNQELIQQRDQAIEEGHVLRFAVEQLEPSDYRNSNQQTDINNSHRTAESQHISELRALMFSSIAGVIATSDRERFARSLFRATRGNAYTHFQVIMDDAEDTDKSRCGRSVFVTYYQGGGLMSNQQSAAAEKVYDICRVYNANVYVWPSSREEAEYRLSELTTILNDKEMALAAYEKYFLGEITVLLDPVETIEYNFSNHFKQDIGSTKYHRPLLVEWQRFCAREKALYTALNLFQASEQTLRADCWFPEKYEPYLRSIITTIANKQNTSAFLLVSDVLDDPANKPPTCFFLPEFLIPFQNLVETYGIANYREANPAIFATVLFPFLFGVMYGDIGHGILLLCVSIALHYAHFKKLKSSDELFDILISARFMIFLMSIYAIFAGFMYNDFLSMGINIFGSHWKYQMDTTYEPISGSPYPFGLDPMWKGAVNELAFLNSLKMKLAILIAFFHMLLGILLKFLNKLTQKEYSDIILECIPQFILYMCIVGYISFLIVFKWVTPSTVFAKPSIIGVFINYLLPMSTGNEDPHDMILYNSQFYIESWLRYLVYLSIPIMLMGKPLYIAYQQSNTNRSYDRHVEASEMSTEMIPTHKSFSGVSTALGISKHWDIENSDTYQMIHQRNGRKEYRFSLLPTGSNLQAESLISNKPSSNKQSYDIMDICLHQLIETIEFCLGTISNTASYLRLWALSLAHQQLSIVFFDQTIGYAIHNHASAFVKIFQLVTLFPIFFACTVLIMVSMDALECFLHALRLQWVEFQNKFYKGEGVLFTPLDLEKVHKVQ